MTKLFALVLVGLTLAACKKDETNAAPPVSPGACFRERDSTCTPYAAEAAAAGKRMCQGFRWIDGADVCPKENVLGLCIREGGTIRENIYGGAPNHFTSDVAEHVCARNRGMFVPQP